MPLNLLGIKFTLTLFPAVETVTTPGPPELLIVAVMVKGELFDDSVWFKVLRSRSIEYPFPFI